MYTLKLMLDSLLFEWRSRRGFMNLLSLFRIAGALAIWLRYQYYGQSSWPQVYAFWLIYSLYSCVVFLMLFFHRRLQSFRLPYHRFLYIVMVAIDVGMIDFALRHSGDPNSEIYFLLLLPLITTAFYIPLSWAALLVSAAIAAGYAIVLSQIDPLKPHLFQVWAARAVILLLATWMFRVLVKFHHIYEERVTSPTSVRNQLERLLTDLRQSVDYDTISVQILYRTHLQIVCCLGFASPKDIYQIEFPSNDKKYPNHQVIASGRTVVADAKDYPSFGESQYFAGHIVTWMGVPLISPDTGECFGMISIDSKKPNAYSAWSRWKAAWFAARISSFLVGAGLGPAALTQATKRENLLELLRQWSQLLPHKTANWEDDTQAARYLAEFGKELFHVEDCSIYFLRHRLDEVGDRLRVLHLVASSTIPAEFFSSHESLATGHRGDGLTGLAVHRNKTFNLGAHQIKRSPYHAKITDHLQYLFSKCSHQIMIVPLRDPRGRARGAIKIENRMGRQSDNPFTPVEEHVLEIYAVMVSLILENTRQRNFIERQMQSIHSLRGIMPHGIGPLEQLLEAAAQNEVDPSLYHKKLEAALNPLVYSKTMLDSILAESGETLLLENEGFIPALHHYVESLRQMPMFKSACERLILQIDELRETLPFRVRVAFYNVAREALLNLVRHAAIESQPHGMGVVRFYREGDGYHLVVQDNGIGFDQTEKLFHHQSFGLNDMLEFQKNIVKKLCQDADLVLQTSPGQGTRVHLWAVP